MWLALGDSLDDMGASVNLSAVSLLVAVRCGVSVNNGQSPPENVVPRISECKDRNRSPDQAVLSNRSESECE
jgi:hypothetical protein